MYMNLFVNLIDLSLFYVFVSFVLRIPRPALMTKGFIRPNTLNKQRGTLLVRMKIELNSFLQPLIKGQNSDTGCAIKNAPILQIVT